MKIEISESDNNNRNVDGKTIVNYITPFIEKKDPTDEENKFKGSGKKYYEASFTFNATVPYSFDSLNNAQDLSKLKQEVLQNKVIAFYKNQWDIIKEKRADDFFSFLFLKEKELSQSTYSSRAELEENFQTYMEPFTNLKFRLEPLENFKLKI
ncbi:hypothetical protein B0A67_19195 [Flavobacterium aquidurense]|jgi:hypothetical protein|uniref:hypothetical protein n=1 Tax=Flavobacterium aquidurense TaxID=362413 RepID=UPI00091DE31E|nr:hypothetical protein [Flavobacterium aquidurense]OXA69616.1 hypothetical protein B0A67_19195 [Flavobacterium aquidurense]SHH70654.1 hypothetical protein SAMN05444481_12441 [Flavobacterium frigidimaris]